MRTHRPVHPGEILAEDLEAMNMPASELARRLHVPPNRITMILSKKRAMTADTAWRLSRFFGTTPDFWMGLQQGYELALAEIVGVEELDEVQKYSAT